MLPEGSPRGPIISFQDINRHGFSRPLTLQQSVPVLLTLVNLTEGMYMLTLDSPTLRTIFLLAGFLCTFLALLLLWVLTTISDPTDPIQLQHRMAIMDGYRLVICSKQLDQQLRKYRCRICNTYTSSKSFHCLKCNRCVDCFDHHCRWVNNCIGARNYFLFFWLVVAALVFQMEVVALNGWWLQQRTMLVSVVLQAITLAVNGVPLLALVYLVGLHLYLLIAKKSTIGLLMQLRKAKVTPDMPVVEDTSRPNKISGELSDTEFTGQLSNAHVLTTLGRTIEIKKQNRVILAPLPNPIQMPTDPANTGPQSPPKVPPPTNDI